MSENFWERIPLEKKEVPQEELETFKNYLHNLNLSAEELQGKKILDVGAGARLFAAHLLREHITDGVYSLEPVIYERAWNRKIWAKLSPEIQEQVEARTLKTLKEAIPLKDGSMDLVLVNCMPISKHAKNEETDELRQEIESMFGEMVRVLAPGGELRYFALKRGGSPGLEPENLLWRGGIMAKLAELKKQGLDVRIEEVAKENESDGSLKILDRVIVRKPKS